MDRMRELGARILVPLDGSSLAAQALPYARALAESSTEVLLLWVVPDPELLRGGLADQILYSKDDVLRADEEAARHPLEAAAESLRDAASTLHVESVVAVGDPAEGILRVAEERAVDLIVLASHGRGALGRWAFGSVADRVSRTAAVPVMIVRSQRGKTEDESGVNLRRLVVPLDGSELAARALPVAERLAKRLALPVLLLSVVDQGRTMSPLLASGTEYGDGLYGNNLYGEIRAELQTKATRLLETASEPLTRAGVSVTRQVLEGSPSAAILDLAGPRDLVVLTSHGRSGVRRWLLGSVAEKLVQEGMGPVLLVRTAEEPAVVPIVGHPTGS